MMVKNLLMFLVVGMVAALPATALASNTWDNGAADGVWANPVNWTGDVLPTNSYVTEEARIDQGSVANIDASNGLTEWDRARIKGGTVNQTGGTHRWRNYTSSNGLGLHRNVATLNMTGGTHYAERVVLGGSIYTTSPTAGNDGVGIINIWGDGTFVVEPNTYNDPNSDIYQVYHLWILDGGSKIDIRDDGKLVTPGDLLGTLQDYEAADKLVAGEAGTYLDYCVVGSNIEVTAVPEPTALLLIGLGLVSLALIRRR